MSPSIVSEDVAGLAEAIGPTPDPVQDDMHERAEREDFPHVGPAVGGWLTQLSRFVDGRRAFEFGSGFGYSAYWIARALPEDGEVVLTEIDADELALAEQYFETGGLAGRARFEEGDAMDVVDRVDGPFDLVLIDHQKTRYRAAFEAIREKVRPGGVILADNAVTAGHIDPGDVRGLVGGEDRPGATEASQGVADYLATVRDDEAYTTTLLPLGEGVSVSLKAR
jgi:caffeoyl-CoA O-methyltransferase